MSEWWRDAVFYEIYVRSFSDANGDGVGDLPGITQRLPYLLDLGVDAIWLTPFYPSPGVDHGYDVADYVDVDPLFGTLPDFDELVDAAHEIGIRVVVDIVPNHTSSAHPWFTGDRSRYVTVPAANGPPNNWPSNWGGSAWTLDEERGEYYLHLFAPEQPDLDWHNEQVRRDFDEILRFWLDRGVDGFRIDVAHGLVKDASLADEPEPFPAVRFSSDWRRAIDQPEVHDVYRDWRRLADSYDGDRVLVGEVVFSDQSRVAPYLRPDELQLAFNFSLVFQPWNAKAMRDSIDESLATLPIVTWVLENHDVTRIATRSGERQARAAALLLLALPGPVFIYQGQELGLEEVDLPDDVEQDPIFRRTHGERKGRDGCRVPVPWTIEPPARSWLPSPASWSARSVEAQLGAEGSMLSLYRRAIALRPRGGFAWRDAPADVLAFDRGELTCVVNLGSQRIPLPPGEIVLASDQVRRRAAVEHGCMDSLSERAQQARGARLSFAVQIAGVVVSYAVQIILARTLGVRGFGTYSYVLAWCGPLSMAAGLGLPTVALRFLPVYRDEDDRAHLAALVAASERIALAASTAIAIVGSALALWLVAEPAPLLVGLWTLPLAVQLRVQSELARSAARFRLAFVLPLIQQLVMLGAAVFAVTVVGRGIGPAGALLLPAVGTAIVVPWLRAAFRRGIKRELAATPKYEIRPWIAAGMAFLAVDAAYTVLNQADSVLVGALGGTKELALFAAATGTASFAMLAMIAAGASTVPSFSRHWERGDRAQLEVVAQRAVRWASGRSSPSRSCSRQPPARCSACSDRRSCTREAHCCSFSSGSSRTRRPGTSGT